MRKHRLGKLLLIVLCVSLLVFLAGCRPSPVLEQIIYEQNHQVDPDTETKTMNDDLENEEPDEDIPSRETVDDSEQEKDQEYTSALAGDTDTDSEDPDAVYSVSYSPNGELSEPAETNPTADSTSETATGSTEPGGNQGGSGSSNEGDGSTGPGGTSEESTPGNTETDTTLSGDNELGNTNTDSNPNNPTPSPDPSTEPPMNEPDENQHEDPPTGTRVTAVGEAATIVEMLGGQLVGTSSSFRDNTFAQQAFASQEVPAWWDGDGSAVISDGNFQALLDAHPEVCFYISDSTFSSEQLAALDAAGIAHMPLPQLNSISNIKEAVTEVGRVLGGDAEGLASDYCSWADNTISWAKGNYSTKATTYIGKWDEAAHWEINSPQGRGTLASGNGVPIGMAYNNVSPLSECMGYAGVINSTVDNYYVEPLYQLQWIPDISGDAARYRPSYVNIIYNDELGVGLGTEAYPAVVVENSSIRDNIYNAEGGNYYWYHWRAGEMIYYRTSWVYGIYLDDGTFLSTRIQNEKEYEILVNPSGVGSWAKGSVESPLEAAWLACEFQGRDMNELRSMVLDFYNTFYHTEANISAIMP